MYRSLVVNMQLREKFQRTSSSDRTRFEMDFDKKYEKYKRKNYVCGVSWEYVIPENKFDLRETLEEIKPFQSQYYFGLRLERKYEPKDYDAAVAFKMNFSYGFMEYDNYHDREELELDTNICDDCTAVDRKEILFLRLDSKKKFRSEYLGLSSEFEDPIISVPLREYLVKSGIADALFKPVKNYRKEVIGYRFYGEKNILPPGSVTSGYQEYQRVCNTCGRTIVDVRFDLDLDKKAGWSISQEGMKCLADANLTYEYRPILRDVIINHKIGALMQEVWPKATNYLIPILLR